MGHFSMFWMFSMMEACLPLVPVRSLYQPLVPSQQEKTLQNLAFQPPAAGELRLPLRRTNFALSPAAGEELH
jgi:hypothetical protein